MSESKRLLDAASQRHSRAASTARCGRSARSAALRRSSSAARARACATPTAGRYIDFVGSWGPLILGHAAPAVVEAVTEAARRGPATARRPRSRSRWLRPSRAAYPSMEMLRLVSSGTEAAMSAIRVARGATGRDLLVKFDGCYHGPRRQPAGEGGLGRRDVRDPRQQGRAGAARQRSPSRSPSTISAAVRELFAASAASASPRSSSSRWPATWAWCRRRRVSRRPARGHRAARRAPDLRRGHHRLSHRVRRRPGAVRRAARPHVPGQDHRRRPAGRRLRRQSQGHERSVAARGRLSGRHALRAIRWPSPPASPRSRALTDRRRLRASRRRSAPGSSADSCEGARKAGVPLTVNRVGSMLTAFFCHGSRRGLRIRARTPTRHATRDSFRRCSSGACIWRRRSSRRPSSRWRTPRPISTQAERARRRRSRPSRECELSLTLAQGK